jgi:hypothetical protein
MKSFKRHYPDFFAKYGMMIDKPLGRSAAVSISELFDIKPSAIEILRYIIAEYYRPFNN